MVRSLYGPFATVAWLTPLETIEQAEAADQAFKDPEVGKTIDAAGSLFVTGNTQSRLIQRLALAKRRPRMGSGAADPFVGPRRETGYGFDCRRKPPAGGGVSTRRPRSTAWDRQRRLLRHELRVVGHGESGHHVGYFVGQPELNPSASLTRSAGSQGREETAEAEQCVPDADGARGRTNELLGFSSRTVPRRTGPVSIARVVPIPIRITAAVRTTVRAFTVRP